MFTRSRTIRTPNADSSLLQNLEDHEIELGETVEVDSVERIQIEDADDDLEVDVTGTDSPRKNRDAPLPGIRSVPTRSSYDEFLRRRGRQTIGMIPSERNTPNGAVKPLRFYIPKRSDPPTPALRHYPSILPRGRRAAPVKPVAPPADVANPEPVVEEEIGSENDDEEIEITESTMLAEKPGDFELRSKMERTRKSKPAAVTPRAVRRIFVVRDPKTGGIQLNKEKEPAVSFGPPPVLKPSVSLGNRPFEFALRLADDDEPPLPETNGITPEDVAEAENAIIDFTGHLKQIQLKSGQRTSILQAAGSMVDKLIAVTKRSKEREASKAEENIRRWIQNEIDNIVEQRLGSLRRNSTRPVWRSEMAKLTEVALTQLMIFRERGTKKQNVLNTSLIEFNIPYIQAHKHGYDVIAGIRRHKDEFYKFPRFLRGFTDVCADFLMNNCHERFFPVNAEKYALLQRCELLFKITLDYSFFTRENGTGKLDRRIRTIRTSCYKKGNSIIPRKRLPKKRTSTADESADVETPVEEPTDEVDESRKETDESTGKTPPEPPRSTRSKRRR